jgi:hypothetical protein
MMDMTKPFTMREALYAIYNMSINENEVYFTPMDRIHDRDCDGRWWLYNLDGTLFIVPLHRTKISVEVVYKNISDDSMHLEMFKPDEILCETEFDKIPAEVLDSEFNVEVTGGLPTVHGSECALLSGGTECTCPSIDDYDNKEEDE